MIWYGNNMFDYTEKYIIKLKFDISINDFEILDKQMSELPRSRPWKQIH